MYREMYREFKVKYSELANAQKEFDLNPSMSTLEEFERKRNQFTEICTRILCTLYDVDLSILNIKD